MPDDWWLDPTKFVDPEDVDSGVAYKFFHDLLVERETEFLAFLSMFRGLTRLTKRQLIALFYQEEAVRLRLDPAKYVAAKMNYRSVTSAHQILQRANHQVEKAEMRNSLEKNAYICVSTHISQTPSDKQIQHRMASMERQCAADGTEGCLHVTRAKHYLCHNCHRVYGSFSEWPGWLIKEARRLRQQHRRDAIASLHEPFSLDELHEHGKEI